MTSHPNPKDAIFGPAKHISDKRPTRSTPSLDQQAQIQKFAIESARLLSDLHCEDVVVFDLQRLSNLTDYMLIATGTSDRQIRSISKDVDDLAEKLGLVRFGREIDDLATWNVLDFVDVVIHLFDPDTRAHYDLEMMWGDAPEVVWQQSTT